MKLYNKLPNPATISYDQYSREVFRKHDLFFQLDKKWTYVDDIDDADIVPILPRGGPITKQLKMRLRDDQLLLVCHWYIIDDHYDLDYFNRLINDKSHLAKNILIVHKNKYLKDIDHPNLLYYDSMFNIAKACFIDYEKYDFSEREWHFYTSASTYQFNKIDKKPYKKFIYPTYVYEPYNHPRIKYRILIRDILDKHLADGYIGSENNRLLPNPPLNDNMLYLLNSNTPQWYPISDEIYNSSYISIVAETITGLNNVDTCFNQVHCVTEKTFEPLAKGNYILPFAYKGMIKDLIDYGFKLPSWIDYSYDNIDDVNERLKHFSNSVDAVLKLNIEELHELYLKDRDILEHNRRIFVDKPYESLYNIIQEFKDKMPR